MITYTDSTSPIARIEPDEVTYFTFGLKYRNEAHPFGPQAHPDGWWEVRGVDRESARRIVAALIGNTWAFDYAEGGFNKDYHALGATYIIDLTAPQDLAVK